MSSAPTAAPPWAGQIEESLWPLVVSIDQLTEDPNNARRHPVRNMAAIKNSLVRFRQQKAIVAGPEGTVVAGNGTYRAARELGWQFIAVSRSTLAQVDLVAYAIMDNKSADLAEWDFEILAAQLRELQAQQFDLSFTGFADFEIEPLLAAEFKTDVIDESLNQVPGEKAMSLKIPADGAKVLRAAIDMLKGRGGSMAKITDAAALVMICGEFLAAAEPRNGAGPK